MKTSQEILNIIVNSIPKDKSEKDCLKSCGINTSFLTDWKNGRIKNPSYDKIIKLAVFLNIDLYQLFFGQNNTNMVASLDEVEQSLINDFRKLYTENQDTILSNIESLLKTQIIKLPCCSEKVSAGFGYNLDEYEQWDREQFYRNDISRKADFVLIVDGDSMNPEFEDGDHVLVRKQPAIDEGQIGIFILNNEGYIKKYGGDRLISLNNKYPDKLINPDDDFKCCGLVLGIAEIFED